MTELLPCPFCGGDATIKQNSSAVYFAQCLKCLSEQDSCTFLRGFIRTKEQAVTDWNTRAPQQGDQQLVASAISLSNQIECSNFRNEYGHVMRLNSPYLEFKKALKSYQEGK